MPAQTGYDNSGCGGGSPVFAADCSPACAVGYLPSARGATLAVLSCDVDGQPFTLNTACVGTSA